MFGKHCDRIFISVMVAAEPVKDFDNDAMWEGVSGSLVARAWACTRAFAG